MERLVPWRTRPSEEILALLAQVNETRIFILHRTGPTSFVVKEETCDINRKVTIGIRPSCTCCINAGGSTVCKELCLHILFVMVKVLRVPPSNPLVWQLSLTDRELEEVLRCSSLPTTRLTPEPKPRSQQQQQSVGMVERRALDEEEELCPICYEDMSGADIDHLVWCNRGCGKNIHGKCMSIWANHQMYSLCKEVLTCPLCRSDWGPFLWRPPPAKRKQKEERKDVHYGTRCAGCKKAPLSGKRFKCLICADLDLCEMCFEGGHHPQHPFACKSSPSAFAVTAERATMMPLVTRLMHPLQGQVTVPAPQTFPSEDAPQVSAQPVTGLTRASDINGRRRSPAAVAAAAAAELRAAAVVAHAEVDDASGRTSASQDPTHEPTSLSSHHHDATTSAPSSVTNEQLGGFSVSRAPREASHVLRPQQQQISSRRRPQAFPASASASAGPSRVCRGNALQRGGALPTAPSGQAQIPGGGMDSLFSVLEGRTLATRQGSQAEGPPPRVVARHPTIGQGDLTSNIPQQITHGSVGSRRNQPSGSAAALAAAAALGRLGINGVAALGTRPGLLDAASVPISDLNRDQRDVHHLLQRTGAGRSVRPLPKRPAQPAPPSMEGMHLDGTCYTSSTPSAAARGYINGHDEFHDVRVVCPEDGASSASNHDAQAQARGIAKNRRAPSPVVTPAPIAPHSAFGSSSHISAQVQPQGEQRHRPDIRLMVGLPPTSEAAEQEVPINEILYRGSLRPRHGLAFAQAGVTEPSPGALAERGVQNRTRQLQPLVTPSLQPQPQQVPFDIDHFIVISAATSGQRLQRSLSAAAPVSQIRSHALPPFRPQDPIDTHHDVREVSHYDDSMLYNDDSILYNDPGLMFDRGDGLGSDYDRNDEDRGLQQRFDSDSNCDENENISDQVSRPPLVTVSVTSQTESQLRDCYESASLIPLLVETDDRRASSRMIQESAMSVLVDPDGGHVHLQEMDKVQVFEDKSGEERRQGMDEVQVYEDNLGGHLAMAADSSVHPDSSIGNHRSSSELLGNCAAPLAVCVNPCESPENQESEVRRESQPEIISGQPCDPLPSLQRSSTQPLQVESLSSPQTGYDLPSEPLPSPQIINFSPKLKSSSVSHDQDQDSKGAHLSISKLGGTPMQCDVAEESDCVLQASVSSLPVPYVEQVLQPDILPQVHREDPFSRGVRLSASQSLTSSITEAFNDPTRSKHNMEIHDQRKSGKIGRSVSSADGGLMNRSGAAPAGDAWQLYHNPIFNTPLTESMDILRGVGHLVLKRPAAPDQKDLGSP